MSNLPPKFKEIFEKYGVTPKPILMNTEMTKATFDDRKNQTRRFFSKRQTELFDAAIKVGEIKEDLSDYYDEDWKFARYHKGDILYIRETFTKWGQHVLYKADETTSKDFMQIVGIKWKPSIHMPKEYARIFLRITNIRVERLQDMPTSDMLKEGISEFKNYNEFRERFSPHDTKAFMGAMLKIKNDWIDLWNKTSPEGYQWENNPPVFVYEFERLEN